MLLGGCIFLSIDLVNFTLKKFFLLIFTADSQLEKTVITWLPCRGALSHVTRAPICHSKQLLGVNVPKTKTYVDLGYI